jgi:hypothetical protein
MLSEHTAGGLHFAGLGASGDTAAIAAQRLAAELQRWAQQHEHCRVLQLSVQPAPQPGTAEPCGLSALIVYSDGGLNSADAAEAVAAAVEEIQQAQIERGDAEPPRFV